MENKLNKDLQKHPLNFPVNGKKPLKMKNF